MCFQIPRNREKVAGLHKTVLTTTIHFRNLNRLGRRRTRLLWGSLPASYIFEVGEISAIRSRAFVDRSWHGGWCGLVVEEGVGAGFSRPPPPEEVSSRSLLRPGAFWEGHKWDHVSTPPARGLSFSSGPETHAVAWYVILSTQMLVTRYSRSRSSITGCIL